MTDYIPGANIRYYILQRELFRIREGEVMPDAWHKGSWIQRPFAFEVETSGHLISEKEAKEWIQDHIRLSRIRSGKARSRH